MKIKGRIIAGHGVASGKSGDWRYPGGTLKHQLPYFSEQGLDLGPYYLGTINLDIAPYEFETRIARKFIENINWSDHIPPENFFFFDVVLFRRDESFKGLIYMPDPSTKVEHKQKKTVLELILPKINGLNYGDTIYISVPPEQMSFHLID